MTRPQFTLRALLIAILVVAAFFGGMALQYRLDRPQESAATVYPLIGPAKLVTLPDGKTTIRREPIKFGE